MPKAWVSRVLLFLMHVWTNLKHQGSLSLPSLCREAKRKVTKHAVKESFAQVSKQLAHPFMLRKALTCIISLFPFEKQDFLHY